jgi:preprotein translocase subunit SecF
VKTSELATRGDRTIDFTRWWKRGLILSAVLIVVSLGSLATRGLELGIDFEGGTSWEVPAPGVSVSDTRTALGTVGQSGAKIQIVGDSTLRVQSATETPETQEQVRQILADLAGVGVPEVSVSTVGPTWGEEISRASLRALFVFFAVILVYLSIRLTWQMGVAALVAMLHDIIITVGVYSVFQFEVTPATVIAFLTILGYSIYDTVVVFDQVKQNQPKVGTSNRLTYTGMVSMSMNQVLVRSINTSITSLLPVISLLLVGSLLLGAVTLQEFGIALFVGLLVGVYSSIFVAAPVLGFFMERDPKNRHIRERLAASRPTSPIQGDDPEATGATLAPASAAPRSASASAGSGTTPPESGTTSPPSGSSTAPRPVGAIPPRPRKKGKRR